MAKLLNFKSRVWARESTGLMTDEEEELLWSRQVLGADTALDLNLTVFYLISQQFGTRGCQEYHQLRVEHLKFVNSPCTGTTEYVEWVEGPTKTRQAGLRKVNRRIAQRMFAIHQIRGAH